MSKDQPPMTPALRALKAAGIEYQVRTYRYEEKGGTATAARQLGVDEHLIIKTLVFEKEDHSPLLVLMHGDRQVSTKALARTIGAKTITPCDPATAQRHTGYTVGGISPFGQRKKLPVYLEAGILDLEVVLINGGRRGLLVEITPRDLRKLLAAQPVSVAI